MASEMKLGLVLSATDRMSVVLDRVNKKFSKFDKAVGGINKASNRMFVAGGVIAAGIWKTIKAAEDDTVAVNRLKNAYKQMWGNAPLANKAAEAQIKYAEKLAMSIGIEHEVINLAQAKLATFKQLSSQTAVMSGMFDRATRAAFDMAAGGFGDAANNAVQLGKALNDPMHGAGAMKKAGTLSAFDVAMVKQIQTTKGLAAAQEYIMTAVEKQFKGAAEKTAKATDIMNVGIKEVVDSIGFAFLPTVDEAKNKTNNMFQPTIDWIDNNHSLIQTIAWITGGLLALSVVMRTGTFLWKAGEIAIKAYKIAALAVNAVSRFGIFQFIGLKIAQYASAAATGVVTAATWLWNAALAANPIVWVVALIAGLVVAIVVCWKKFAGFRAVILTTWETIKGFGGILKDYVIDRIKGIISGLGSMGKAIGLLFKGKFKEAAQEAGKGIKALSGYDAAMNAFSSSKKLVGTVSQTYTGILKKEQEAQKGSESVTAMKSATVKNNSSATSSLSPTVNYSPVIHMAPGTSQATVDSFKSMLQTHKNDIIQIMKNDSNNGKRISFTPAF